MSLRLFKVGRSHRATSDPDTLADRRIAEIFLRIGAGRGDAVESVTLIRNEAGAPAYWRC